MALTTGADNVSAFHHEFGSKLPNSIANGLRPLTPFPTLPRFPPALVRPVFGLPRAATPSGKRFEAPLA